MACHTLYVVETSVKHQYLHEQHESPGCAHKFGRELGQTEISDFADGVVSSCQEKVLREGLD
jgi:hypothetical protein